MAKKSRTSIDGMTDAQYEALSSLVHHPEVWWHDLSAGPRDALRRLGWLKEVRAVRCGTSGHKHPGYVAASSSGQDAFRRESARRSGSAIALVSRVDAKPRAQPKREVGEKKKPPAQLRREIAAALATRPSKSAAVIVYSRPSGYWYAQASDTSTGGRIAEATGYSREGVLGELRGKFAMIGVSIESVVDEDPYAQRSR